MKTKEVYSLQKGEKIDHKHYGVCTVKDMIHDFGPCIVPDTKEGRALLKMQSGVARRTPLLETSFRLISAIKEAPVKTGAVKLIGKRKTNNL